MAIAEWKYPFPSRTRKSSALTPMVLQRCGRVGSRQALFFCPPRASRAMPGPFDRAVRHVLSLPWVCALRCGPLRMEPFVGLRALRFVRSCEAVHAALSPHSLLALHRSMLRRNSILHASSSSLGASSPHHSQCIRGRSVASVASVVVVASVVSVTFVPSVASVVHARCPLLERTSKCGQFFVRFSQKNKNADNFMSASSEKPKMQTFRWFECAPKCRSDVGEKF